MTCTDPDFSNVCQANINSAGEEVYNIPNSCAGPPIGGTENRIAKQVCPALMGGDSGEWVASSAPSLGLGGQFCDRCGSYSSKGISDYPLYRQLQCSRTRYTGDPTSCCFRDYEGNIGQTDTYCFSSNTGVNTCSTCNRNITSSSCDNIPVGVQGEYSPCNTIVTDYCAPPTFDLGTATEIWNVSNAGLFNVPYSFPLCRYALARMIYPTLPSQIAYAQLFESDQALNTLPISQQGLEDGRVIMTNLIESYQNTGYILGSDPSSASYSPFQDTILEICKRVPYWCSSALTTTCSGESLTSITTQNIGKLPFCGCYLSNSQYQQYIDQFQIDIQCTPTCSRSDVVPIATPSGTGVLECNQSICLLDQININISNSSVGGDISFSQVCAACGTDANCNCQIDNTSITAYDASIGGNINFSQNCGPQSRCNATLPNGSTAYIPCNETVDQYLIQQAENEISSLPYIYYIILIILVILLIVGILYFFS